MDFNFDTGTIYGGIQTIDPTTLPPLGGTAGVLTISGTGALLLPGGTTLQEPVGAGGMLRYNTAGWLEYYDAIAASWQVLSYASGSVLSFSLNDNSTTPIYTVSPTTSATGAVAATMALSTQTANTVFSGPGTGSAAQPTFRSLVAADLPPVTNLAGGAIGNIVYQSAPNTTAFLVNGTSGYVLTSNGVGSAPSYAPVVTSFQTSLSGLTPSSSTTGAVTLAGTLGVASGGTGATTLTTNGVVFGNATSAVGITAAGSQYNVLTVDALGVPIFGAVNLAQGGTAVTGILPLANGGTNTNTSGSNGSIMYNNGTAIVNSTVGTLGQALISGGAGAPTWTTVSSTITTNQIVQGNGSGAFTANGGTFVGSGSYSGVTLSGTVTGATDAVTKSYVDSLAAGLGVHGAVEAADTASEITGATGMTYTPGVAGGSPDAGTGVGATLSGTGSMPVIGGYTLSAIGQRVLVKMFGTGIYSLGTLVAGSGYDVDSTYTSVPLTGGIGTSAVATIVITGGSVTSVTITSIGSGYAIGNTLSANDSDLGGRSSGSAFNIPVKNLQNMQNGIYVATTLTGGWILTRASDFNNSVYGDAKAGAFVYVSEGTAAGQGWTETAVGTQMPGDALNIGLDSIVFTQFSGSGTYTAGAGLNLGVSGTQFNVQVDSATTHINGSNQVAVLSSSTSNQTLLSTGAGNTPSWGALPLGNSSAVTGILGTANGGTGLDTSAATNGQLLIGNSTGLTLAALTAGTGIGVSNGAGSITISNSGVTSFSASTTGLTPSSATTGAITLGGTLVVGNGGTGVTSLTTNGVLYGGSTVGATAVGTTGQVLIGNTGAAPSWTALSGIAVTSFQTSLSGLTPSTASNGVVTLAGTLGISSGGTGQVTKTAAFDALSPTSTAGDLIYSDGTNNLRLPVGSAGQVLTVVTGEPAWSTLSSAAVTTFSGDTTGLTPSTPTSGPIVLGGSLNIVNGGTGLSSLGTANQIFGMNAAGTAAEYKTLTAGTGMSVINTANTVTFNNTGVTSVGLSLPGIFNVTVSPITTTGSLTATLATQTANTVFAGPATGSAAAPTFRSLAYADLPISLYVENPSTPTAPVASGSNAVAVGSGSVASATGSYAEGAGANASIYGQKAYANGSFAVAGDAQHGIYVLRQQTSDVYGQTAIEMFLDGAAGTGTERIVMPNDSVFTFDILVAARRALVTGGGAAYRFVGAARRDTTDGSVTFIGTPSKTIVGETDVSWDANVSVNTASGTGGFTVLVTGEATKTINWVATVSATEVRT